MIDDDDIRRIDAKSCRDKMTEINRGEKRKSRKNKYSELGLCCRCEMLHAETTMYGTKRHWCTADRPRKLSANDPIVDCTDYVDAGQMPLSLMLGMATPIDAKRHKPVGFIYDEDELWDSELIDYD